MTSKGRDSGYGQASRTTAAALVGTIRCPVDGGPLRVAEIRSTGDDRSVACLACGASFPYVDGVLDLLDDGALDEPSAREREIREEHAVRDGLALSWQHSPDHMTEIRPTLAALGKLEGRRLLELGCGNGRYTVLLARQALGVVAVDFSREALIRLRDRLGPLENVLLVRADITRLEVGRAEFDAVLSTLVSNLPTRAHRSAMYRLAAEALPKDGRFVFGTHHYGIRERYLGEDQVGRYADVDIYRRLFTLGECRSDPKEYFERVSARPVQIYLPIVRRLPWPPAYLQSRVLEWIPLLRLFGALTVCVASRPREPGPRR